MIVILFCNLWLFLYTGSRSKIWNREDYIHVFTTASGNKIWNNLKKNFSVWLIQFLKKHNKSKFSWLLYYSSTFFKIKIQPNMSEQEKKRAGIYDLLKAKTKPKFLCLLYTKQRKSFYRKRAFSGKVRVEDWTKKWKEGFLTAPAMVIKRDPTMSIRKHDNELKVYEKTVRIVIKTELSPYCNPFDYDFLEKTNPTFHPNVGLLKTAIEEEWKKCLENLFWQHKKGKLIQ